MVTGRCYTSICVREQVTGTHEVITTTVTPDVERMEPSCIHVTS